MVVDETTHNLFPADLFGQPGDQPAIVREDLSKLDREIQQRGTSRFKLLLVTHPAVPTAVLEAFARSER